MPFLKARRAWRPAIFHYRDIFNVLVCPQYHTLWVMSNQYPAFRSRLRGGLDFYARGWYGYEDER